MAESKKNYVTISSDTHCGANLLDYKPYLEKKYHEEFDDWAPSFTDPWKDYDALSPSEYVVGQASFMADVNWDNPKRQARLEEQGVVGEILFPNTVPPFFPSGLVSAPAPASPPSDRHEYELRFAGLRAHNRWVADFARDLPGRRAGLAQIFLSDVDETLAEVRRARADGLVGVLLPPDHFSQLQNVYFTKYEVLWNELEELDMSIGRHGVIAGEANSPETGHSAAIGVLESVFFARRVLTALIIGGIFERHPNLKFVITEACGSWVPGYVAGLDGFIEDAKVQGSLTNINAADAVKELTMKPSEYFAKHCYIGSFLTDSDIAMRHQIGVDRIMWGADFPHHEETSPHTHLAFRRNFAGLPEDEVRMMLGETAAEVYGFDLDFLQTVADKFGPSVDEVNRPLSPDEVPSYPDQTVCPTFVGDYAFAND
jgi:predicted TIM-barrel fold metal-dependent hydrolase